MFAAYKKQTNKKKHQKEDHVLHSPLIQPPTTLGTRPHAHRHKEEISFTFF